MFASADVIYCGQDEFERKYNHLMDKFENGCVSKVILPPSGYSCRYYFRFTFCQVHTRLFHRFIFLDVFGMQELARELCCMHAWSCIILTVIFYLCISVLTTSYEQAEHIVTLAHTRAGTDAVGNLALYFLHEGMPCDDAVTLVRHEYKQRQDFLEMIGGDNCTRCLLLESLSVI